MGRKQEKTEQRNRYKEAFKGLNMAMADALSRKSKRLPYLSDN